MGSNERKSNVQRTIIWPALFLISFFCSKKCMWQLFQRRLKRRTTQSFFFLFFCSGVLSCRATRLKRALLQDPFKALTGVRLNLILVQNPPDNLYIYIYIYISKAPRINMHLTIVLQKISLSIEKKKEDKMSIFKCVCNC